MARIVLVTLLIVLLNVLVGCYAPDSGMAQLVPAHVKVSPGSEPLKVVRGSEIDIIEQMAINRKAYRNGLESLIAYYNNAGNNMKLGWVQNELKKLDGMPQYNYIVEANIAGPDLKAVTSIPLADYMYQDARRLEKRAGKLILVKNEKMLRLALEKYNQLIKKHPSSDKIDDAAYRAAGIFEHFKDYTIALLYYQRAYQWNPEITLPARFKVAYILDRHLKRRKEALEFYRQAVKTENIQQSYKEFAQKRIKELMKLDEGSKAEK